MLTHKILRTTRLIILRLMRDGLLRHKSGNLDTRKAILSCIKVLLTATERRVSRQLIHVVVSIITAADDGGLELGIWDCASEVAATCAGGSGCSAAVAVAAGGEDAGEEFGDEGAGAGEGGADDGDVAFDGGPFCGADVVVCIGRCIRLGLTREMV